MVCTRSINELNHLGEKSCIIVYLQKTIMIIERTAKEVIFRLPVSTKLEDLQEIADLFTFQEISRESKATQKDVDDLVKKIKKGRWAKTKKQLGL